MKQTYALLSIFTLLPLFGISAQALSVKDQQGLHEFLSSDTVISNIQTMESQGKLTGELSAKPWAGFYWPDGFGGLVDPYRDHSFPHSMIRIIGPNSGFNRSVRWLKNSFRGENLTPSIYSLNERELDTLSPAEKYDLLVNVSDYPLSHSILNDIQARMKKIGKRLATWEGICNGWSLAALNVDRPLHPVTVATAQGRPVTFYPHDIMALASLLYARSPINNWGWFTRDDNGTRSAIPYSNLNPEKVPGASFEPIWLKFFGRRCYKYQDKSGCGDLNPAALHMAVVNSIGYQDSGFIMDKHEDPSISNVAVFGYKASLFNPKNNKNGSYAESVQVVDGQTKIGVDMEVEYRKELAPFSLDDKDVSHYWDFEKSGKMKFSYTLILDSKGNIIDGEWSKRVKAPDFLWKLPKGSMAFSGNEGNLNMFDWNVKSDSVPASWIPNAKKSAIELQPLGVIIYNLVNESRR